MNTVDSNWLFGDASVLTVGQVVWKFRSGVIRNANKKLNQAFDRYYPWMLQEGRLLVFYKKFYKDPRFAPIASHPVFRPFCVVNSEQLSLFSEIFESSLDGVVYLGFGPDNNVQIQAFSNQESQRLSQLVDEVCDWIKAKSPQMYAKLQALINEVIIVKPNEQYDLHPKGFALSSERYLGGVFLQVPRIEERQRLVFAVSTLLAHEIGSQMSSIYLSADSLIVPNAQETLPSSQDKEAILAPFSAVNCFKEIIALGCEIDFCSDVIRNSPQTQSLFDSAKNHVADLKRRLLVSSQALSQAQVKFTPLGLQLYEECVALIRP